MGHVAPVPRRGQADRRGPPRIPAGRFRRSRARTSASPSTSGTTGTARTSTASSGTRYFLKDALGIAAGLHEFFRNSDIFFMANYAQTVNVIGAIKTNKTRRGPRHDRRGPGLVPEPLRNNSAENRRRPRPLDVAAAWKDGKKILTVAVVNPSAERQRLPLSFKGVRLAAKAKLFRITGPDPLSKNVPGREPEVKTVETAGVPFGGTLDLPPMSVSLYEIAVR
ncbi:MAG: hypothetical protein MZV63_06260 [Marinilabiliales bacterium]|nr:hypothetical protein [Marinilabiliales bacterium]